MLRFAADENFNGDIVRGLLRRNPQLDVVRVQDAGLSGADDPSVLAPSRPHRSVSTAPRVDVGVLEWCAVFH